MYICIFHILCTHISNHIYIYELGSCYIQKISGECLQKFSRKQSYVTCLFHNTLYLENLSMSLYHPQHDFNDFTMVVSNKDVS